MKIGDIMTPAQLDHLLAMERKLFERIPIEDAVPILLKKSPEELIPDVYLSVLAKHLKHSHHAAGMYRMLIYIAYFLDNIQTEGKPN